MSATLADIARAAGVDRSTVCRVLKDEGRVSPETRQRIKNLAREMNYVPNPIARSLILGKSTFVGVVADPVITSIYELIVDPIEQLLRSHGLSMLLVRAPLTKSGEEEVLRQLMSYQTAGLIAIRSSMSPETTVYQEFVESGGKMVVLYKPLEGLKVPQIVSSDYLPSKLAAEHLLELGHRRIAHLTIDRQLPSRIHRDRGFRDALENAGIEVDESLIVPTALTHEAGKHSAQKLLAMKNPPTAIVTRADAVALGAIDACISAGLSVPEDMSITGIGNFWHPGMMKVPLTTVGHPCGEMAQRGTDTLVRMIRGEDVPPETVALGAELIVRESTGPPHVDHRTAKAIPAKSENGA